jgi:alpha-L-rhamnosidase
MNKFFRPIIFACLLLLSLYAAAQTSSKPSDNLETRFLNPPTSVKPYVWWHWMDSNFSKEGITKDLEVMKESGIGGTTILNLSSIGLFGPVRLITESEVKL